jgi:hypothetical protein
MVWRRIHAEAHMVYLAAEVLRLEIWVCMKLEEAYLI